MAPHLVPFWQKLSERIIEKEVLHGLRGFLAVAHKGESLLRAKASEYAEAMRKHQLESQAILTFVLPQLDDPTRPPATFSPEHFAALERLRHLQQEARELTASYDLSTTELLEKYFQKLERMTGEWIAHYQGRQGPQEAQATLRALHSLREVFSEHVVGELRRQLAQQQLRPTAPQALRRLSEQHGPAMVADGLALLASEGALGFPLKRIFLGSPLGRFEALRAYRYEVAHDPYQPQNIRFQTRLFSFTFDGRPVLLVSQPEDYATVDVIGDYFQEEQRLRAKRADQEQAPWDAWRSPRVTFPIFQRLLEAGEPLTTEALREAFYREVKECTQFKPSLVVSIIRLLGGTRYLDISAGWGDRLIGSMAAGVQCYVGVDPNLDLKPGHDEIIRTFAPLMGGHGSEEELLVQARERFRVIYAPFQTAELPQAQTFDLIFTSPPFFDFEIYSQRQGQSVLDFPGLDDWMVGFLFASLEKAWARLEDGGHLAIHITDVFKTRICEPMNLFIQHRLLGAYFRGVVSSSGRAERPRPIWVWRKELIRQQEKDHRDLLKKAEADLAKFFPSVSSRLQAQGKKRKHEED